MEDNDQNINQSYKFKAICVYGSVKQGAGVSVAIFNVVLTIMVTS